MTVDDARMFHATGGMLKKMSVVRYDNAPLVYSEPDVLQVAC
jgi:hypothetical protein